MTAQGQPIKLLVIGPIPVTRKNRGEPVLPNNALVYTREDGVAEHLAGRPTKRDTRMYRYRYDVDLSERSVQWTEALPSATGGFSFQITLDARWQVSDPIGVVSRDIRTLEAGRNAVCSGVRDLLWRHAGRYCLEDGSTAESFIRSALCGQEHDLPAGLRVLGLAIRLYLDQEAQDHLRNLKRQMWEVALVQGQHEVTLAEQTSDAVLHAGREQALLDAMSQPGGLTLYLMAQDPSQIGDIMGRITERHDVTVEQKTELLRMLIDAKLIQPPEAQEFYHSIHQGKPRFDGPEALPGGHTTAPDAPSPPSGPPRLQAAPGPRSPSGAPGHAGPPRAAPDGQPFPGNVSGSIPVGRRRHPGPPERT